MQYFQAWMVQDNQTINQVESVLTNKNKTKTVENKNYEDGKYGFYTIWDMIQQQVRYNSQSFNCIICYFNQNFSQISLFGSYFALSMTTPRDNQKQKFFPFEKQVQHETSQSMINYLKNKVSTNMILWSHVLLLYMLFMRQLGCFQYFQVWKFQHDQTLYHVYCDLLMKNEEKIMKNEKYKDEKYHFIQQGIR